MKSLFLFFLTLGSLLVSCEKNNDCSCVVSSKKALPGAKNQISVADWGGDCGDIKADNIPDIDPNSNVSCYDM